MTFLVYAANLDWNYGSSGPDAWPFLSQFPQCAALAQSPIDIITSSALPDNSLVDINFNNYNQNIKFKLRVDSYTGKTSCFNVFYDENLKEIELFRIILVKAEPDYTGVTSRPSISGSNYPSSFELLQFHFHWGQVIKFFLISLLKATFL